MIDVRCLQCGALMRLDDAWAGRKGRCPKCATVVEIPAASPPASPSVVPPVIPPGASAATTALLASLPRWWWMIAAASAVGAALLIGVLVAVFVFRGGNGELASVEPSPPSAASPGDSPIVAPDDKPEGNPSAVDAPPVPRHTRPREATATDAPVASETAPAPGGWRGMSGRYDDRHCRDIQARHGVRIPAAANVIEVDGRRLPLQNPGRLADSPSPLLALPRGTHAVRFRTGELPLRVEVVSDLSEEYEAMRRFFDVAGKIDGEELLGRSARAMDVHGAPYLLNFLGAVHAAANRWDAAERCFRRALCVNPAFAPAHMNLAECLTRRSASADAAREVELADALNVGNAFGLTAAITALRRRLELPLATTTSVDCAALSYISAEPLSEEDRRLAALMKAMSKYATSAAERAKVLNNLAVHFADSGRPERALHHFREAMGEARLAGPERFALARRVFANMSDVCRKAGFAEADEYRRMQDMVTP